MTVKSVFRQRDCWKASENEPDLQHHPPLTSPVVASAIPLTYCVHERTSLQIAAATAIQSLVRGHLSRTSVRRMRRQLLDEVVLGGRATAIQRLYRGHRGRLVFLALLRDSRCRVLQKAARGFLGRYVLFVGQARVYFCFSGGGVCCF